MTSLGEDQLLKSLTEDSLGSRMSVTAPPLLASVRRPLPINRDPEVRRPSRTIDEESFEEVPSRRDSPSYLRGCISVPRMERDQVAKTRKRHSWDDPQLTQNPA